MSVSARLRYEILRRDGHACRYCGATAPDVKLTVDHVVPVALGGGDEASNLVTACSVCNAGKSSSAPDSPIVDAVDADALRWAAAMRRAAQIQAEDVVRRANYTAEFDRHWKTWTYGDGDYVERPADWAVTVGRWFDMGVDLEVLLDLIDNILPRQVRPSGLWRYFCGAMRNVLRDRQEIARHLIDSGEE